MGGRGAQLGRYISEPLPDPRLAPYVLAAPPEYTLLCVGQASAQTAQDSHGPEEGVRAHSTCSDMGMHTNMVHIVSTMITCIEPPGHPTWLL